VHLHRQGAKLVALVAATVIAFFGTRMTAERDRATAVRDAATWSARGRQARAADDLPGAVDAFRRAVLKDRDNSAYALALADALAASGQIDAAERILLDHRAAAPEDATINLQLARLAARRNDIPTAVRYYRNALYAAWSDTDAPRRIRMELIRLLLDRGDPQRALAEIVGARATVPNTVAGHVELAGLFQRAGDAQAARQEYDAALRLDPRTSDALIGAGRASFTLGDYRAARRYLSGASALDGESATMLAITERVLDLDPLERGLGSGERRRRIEEVLTHARTRLEGCGAAAPAVDWPRLPRRIDQDDVEQVLEVVARAEDIVAAQCGPLSDTDRALQIVARRHGPNP
jgi:tetratricopeptide (TPR) repeat protein